MSAPVVSLEEPSEGLALVVMQEREAKNTFTPALLSGLFDAFHQVAADRRFRAVVLTGYDTYFACGGTRDDLLAIQAGEASFTQAAAGSGSASGSLYSLPLDCPLPVVAAMQGHAIGGGLCLGLFCDLVVLSSESVYTASFMKYGFTPGFGATRILPEKLGVPLATEMLMTAGTYRGSQLRERGVPFPVLPRRDVLAEALRLGRSLADKPRVSLETLKEHLVSDLRQQLPEVIRRELLMHDVTFALPDVKERILSMYA